MLIKDAVHLVKSATLSASRNVSLVCSFEPLHLHTYLQAHLAERFPAGTPGVVTFGYDQLRTALAATSDSLRSAPVLFCVSWSDLHPALSWRTRAQGAVGREDLVAEAERLHARLTEWLAARRGAETFLAPPPLDFLPSLDACSPRALGRLASTASALMANLLADASSVGARVLRTPSFDLNYRDLLLSGSPFSPEHADSIAGTFVDLAFPSAPRMKAVVTDLDGTLWHGVIGEDDAAALACGPEGRGYPFHVFQQFLQKLKREGILLAFCSKNNPEEVLPVFDSLDMPLKLSDFSAYRCDWEPKSAGILAIARDLNIGPNSLLVIDDNAAEIAEIRHGAPDVEVWQTPRDGTQWRELFRALQERCATWTVSDADRGRSAAMAGERLRRTAQSAGFSCAVAGEMTHLRDMQLDVQICEQAFDDPRSVELINRTNQFNLTGERFAADQWLDVAAAPGAFCWSARLRDRFGDFGIVCVVTGRVEGPVAHLRQFVLSCRALGRGLETIVLGEVCSRLAVRELRGPFLVTGRNEPARRFLAGLGADIESAGGWRLDAAAVVAARDTVVAQTDASVAVAPSRDPMTPA